MLELVSFQCGDRDAAACVLSVTVSSLFFPSRFSLSPQRGASVILSEWGERTDLDQLSSGFPKLKQPAHILDHISGSYYFFFLGRERGRGGLALSSFAHQLLEGNQGGVCMMMVALQ